MSSLKRNDINKTMTSNDKLANLQKSIESKIIGQSGLIESMLVCLLCDGHALIEGMPGLAKTRAAKALAEGIDSEFHRIQFTPDLLPSDLIGTDIYLHEKNDFSFRQGPLFHNIVLADEINRAPAKVQSALLEAMEEKQITVGQNSYKLPDLFMVLATQNPIEQEGTYNLPEAQLDRFLMHIVVDYPSQEEELQILQLQQQEATKPKGNKVKSTSQEEVLAARSKIHNVYMDEKLNEYIVSLVTCTRSPQLYDENLAKLLRAGVSPRATLALSKCSKALAWLHGDEYVSPKHIQKVAPNILRHRIIPSFEAEAEGISREAIIQNILEIVAIP